MEIPMIDLNELHGDKRSQTMALIDHACEKWGCFQIKNHGVDLELMEKVKELVNGHYEQSLKRRFFESDVAKGPSSNADWETSFFIRHLPHSDMESIENLTSDFGETMNKYIDQLVKLAENLSELMSENLGLEKDHIKVSFSGPTGPSVGTKVAKYPPCPNPELVSGLREHTDAGGIILLLRDDEVPGLQFLHRGAWVAVPPAKEGSIFVNTGDQIEILSNGRYRSVLHRIVAEKNRSRLSVATFYNPSGEAVISPATELMYPGYVRFRDYLELYAATKFSDKGTRFELVKKMMLN